MDKQTIIDNKICVSIIIIMKLASGNIKETLLDVTFPFGFFWLPTLLVWLNLVFFACLLTYLHHFAIMKKLLCTYLFIAQQYTFT